VELGYIKQGQKVGDIPADKIDDFARDLADRVGARKAWSMFNVQTLFRKRMPDGFKAKMIRGRDAIAEEYPERMVPKQAVARWKAMSSRARRMARR